MARRANMTRILILLGAAATGGAFGGPVDWPATKELTHSAVDDGTYLKRIDPLGGHWLIQQIGDADFTKHRASITFSEGGFLNHGAGCRGGYPAFYQIKGDALTISRLEQIRTGKCGDGSTTARKSAASERRLGSFLDQTVSWSKPDDRSLILVARDGTRALLVKPVEQHPELAGRWIIELIAGKRFVTESRSPILSIAMGSMQVYADCNSMSSSFTISSPGRIAVAGPMMSTLIGCSPQDQAEDALMSGAVASATAHRLENQRLYITGSPGMVLRRPPAPNRTLVGDYEHCGNTLLGAYHDGPVKLTIDKHTIRDNAGCTASYGAAGPDLSLSLSTDEVCVSATSPYKPGAPAAIGGKISTLAVAKPDGFGFDDHGQLILRTERGLLSMCRTGAQRPFGS